MIFTISCLALDGCSKGGDQKGNEKTKEEQKQEQKSDEKQDEKTVDIQRIFDVNDPMKITDNSVHTTVTTIEKADGKTETTKSTQIYKLDEEPKIIKIVGEEDLNGVKTIKLVHNVKINDISELFGSDGENEDMKEQIEDMKKYV